MKEETITHIEIIIREYADGGGAVNACVRSGRGFGLMLASVNGRFVRTDDLHTAETVGNAIRDFLLCPPSIR